MESIVSPWIIYLLSLVDVVNDFGGFFAVILSIAMVIHVIVDICIFNDDYESDKEQWAKFKANSGIKFLKVLWVLCLLIGFLLPSKNTIIAMYATDKITYNSVQKAVDIGRDVKNTIKKDVIDILQSLNKKEESK